MGLSHGEGIFNSRLSESNRLMFSLLFVSWKFLWEDKALMEGDKVMMGDPLSPHWGKPWTILVTKDKGFLCSLFLLLE